MMIFLYFLHNFAWIKWIIITPLTKCDEAEQTRIFVC